MVVSKVVLLNLGYVIVYNNLVMCIYDNSKVNFVLLFLVVKL